MIVTKYVWFPGDVRRKIVGDVDVNNVPQDPTFEQWCLYGFSGMNITQWLTWGRPRRTKDDLSPPGGPIANAVEESKYRDQPEIIEAWFQASPGSRAQFEATAGLEYSPEMGAFVGYHAPGVETPADAAMIETTPAPSPAVAAPAETVPAPSQAVVAMEPVTVGCGSEGCPPPSPDPFQEPLEPPPMYTDPGPEPAAVDILAGPDPVEGLEASFSLSWGTFAIVALLFFAAKSVVGVWGK